ncbi:hypothetical protein ACJX0J_016008 [Zea mays]
MLRIDLPSWSVPVLLYISINRKTGALHSLIIYPSEKLYNESNEARFNEGFPIFCITSHLKLLEDITYNITITHIQMSDDRSIQKAKVLHVSNVTWSKGVHFSSWFLHIYLNKMMDPSTSRM